MSNVFTKLQLLKIFQKTQGNTSRKRFLTIAGVLGVVIVTAAVSWIAGSKVKSPAELAAQAEPPQPSEILVPIEEKLLSSNIVVRGTARYGLPQTVSVADSKLKSDTNLVTSVNVKKNDQLYQGSLLMTISSRPVFAFYGRVTAYRDLIPGSSGDDVKQLEDAMQRLGYYPGPIDGLFDSQTSAAVQQFYTAKGYEAFGITDTLTKSISDLELELTKLKNEKSTADEAKAAASKKEDEARAQAESDNQAAAIAVTEATTSAEITQKEADQTAIQLAGEVAIQAAVDAKNTANREANETSDKVNKKQTELDTAKAKAGVQVPLDEIVFLPTLPVRVEQVDVKVGDSVSGSVMTVTNNQLAIDSSLALDEAQLVKPGMTVQIDEPSLGISATGVVEQVASTPGTKGVDGFHVYFETFVDDTEINLEGFSLRLTIPVESTDGKVLAVPLSAISLAPDGSSQIQVEKDGQLEFVTVELGLSAEGYVEVTSSSSELKVGQNAVIGFDNKQ